jgi:hypothetical protein
MKLRGLAHSRSGDKGAVINISLIAFEDRDYPRLARHVTVAHVREHFAELFAGEVTRYELPALGALNFVLRGRVGGGVTSTQALDPHGKSFSSALLEMEIPDEDPTAVAGDDGGAR